MKVKKNESSSFKPSAQASSSTHGGCGCSSSSAKENSKICSDEESKNPSVQPQK